MTMKRWDGSAYVDISTAKRWDGSAWVDLTIAKRWDGSAWVDITLPGGGGGTLSITASLNPVTTEFVEGADELTASVTSYAVTCTATGGTGPYTYAWTYVSGASSVLCNSPSSNTTTFEAIIYREASRSAVWKCTVTDSAAATASVNVTVNLTR